MSGDFEDKVPNAETVAAIAEIESGGGETFEWTAQEAFNAILAAHDQQDQAEDWHPMNTAPRDRFVRYRLADGSGEIKGCTDTVRPGQVWDPSISKYWPSQHFSGWKILIES